MYHDLPVTNGAATLDAAIERLGARLPDPLAPLARIAFNYRWAWTPGGAEAFAALGPQRWRRAMHNPVRMLVETSPAELEQAAADAELVAKINDLDATLTDDLRRPASELAGEGPIAFLCAEFGIHRSLPIYSGGLGVLAGDILKEASDLALPMVGVGLLYRRGYFHQRLDRSGWQHEYWVEVDPELLPMTRVQTDGSPLRVTVPIWGREVAFAVWRVEVGRVPLFLLDADLPENTEIDRWITSRLYDGNRDVRLAQYAALGVGGVRVLRALGIEPATVHLNEGHAALAALELTAPEVAEGAPPEQAQKRVRDRVVFTTHTPVAAGNETYEPYRIVSVLGDLAPTWGLETQDLLALGRVVPEDTHAEAGMTPIALRLSRSVNGVSERHGEVAREMWAGLYRTEPSDVPISHITNGVHLPTWMRGPMRELLDGHLGTGWPERAHDPDTWQPVADIPARDLWKARCESRRQLIEWVQRRIGTDRLARGEDLGYVNRAIEALDPDALTLGFARRVAAYKRLHLLRHDPERVLKLLDDPHPVQLLFAGKAHPADDGAKGILQSMFELKGAPLVAERVAFIEDYGLASGAMLVMGADVWVNVPRPPLEASGTSGMKSALNGGLNLSVLDGWWAEGYDGDNGWAISGEENPDHAAQDAAHADELYRLLEDEVLPLFHHRDDDGVPVAWVEKVRAALMSVGPRFCATRMMRDYSGDVYRR
ncbi:MAG: alpha-glucan family phosphorylase [Nitriliruptorales bacterium]|nr:alpha-glucan family phosphorylase [Nitriliruptorales bacterium]